MSQKNDIHNLLTRGVAEVIIKEELEKKLRSGKKLRIKYGIDPTGDCIHIGHAVALWKLREFQEQGHRVILLIGDITARIGDPSGRSKERKILSERGVAENMKTYLRQASLILDMSKTELRYNSEWFGVFSIAQLMELTARVTFTRVSHRAEFKKRLAAGGDISVLELLYPIFQGYDSVMLKSDVELGGTDQKFNMLMGRHIQQAYGQPPQNVITIPLLEGLDGKEKMSKTSGNFIALADKPDMMYGKVMSIPDILIPRYCELATRMSLKEVSAKPPRDAKMCLAHEIVSMYHGEKKAQAAQERFISIFQKKEAPDDMPEIILKQAAWSIVDLLVAAKLASSKSEARRLIAQKGVTLNGKNVSDPAQSVNLTKKGALLKKGKRHFVRVVLR